MTTAGLLFAALFPCYGSGKIDNQFLNNFIDKNGVFKDYKDLMYKKGWQNKPSQAETTVNIYVNCETGIDKPKQGLSPKKPFKTISYAISNVPFIRDSSDYYVNINIARGTYNETFSINYDKIILVGEGNNNTFIAGPDANSIAIDISDSKNCEIRDIKVINAGSGISLYSSSVLISNAILENNSIGIAASMNSTATINNCELNHNVIGLNIWEDSNGSIMGNTTIDSNDMVAVSVSGNSSVVIFPEANVVMSDNNGGFLIRSTSNLSISNGSSLSINNSTNYGIFVYSGSSIEIAAGKCTISDNVFGLFASDSNVDVLFSGELIIENSSIWGISLTNNSTLTSNILGYLTIRNNNTGIFAHGSVINISGENSIIDNNQDVILSFGARASIGAGVDIGSINCDGTILIEGNYACP